MESQPSDAETAAKKAKAKAAHRASMAAIGWSWVFVAGLTAYLAFSKGAMPAFLYGHLFGPSRAAAPRLRTKIPPVLVHWRDWNSDTLRFALKSDRLIFLNLDDRGAGLMDETVYNEPLVATYIEKNFVAVKADIDERPDLELRYAAARPTTALLLPKGDLITAAGPMDALSLMRWAQGTVERYRLDPARDADLIRRSARGPVFDAGELADPDRPLAHRDGIRAAAVLSDAASDDATKRRELDGLERWWNKGVYQGEVRRMMTTGVQCLLPDQIGLAAGFEAAYRATRDKRWLERSVALVRAVEQRLMDEKTGALFDRPAWGELPSGLDQIILLDENLEARKLYENIVRDLPVGDPFRERLKSRVETLRSWVTDRVNAGDFTRGGPLSIMKQR